MVEEKIGFVEHYFDKISVAAISLTDGGLAVGDTIHIKGHTSDFEQAVDSIQIEHEKVETAKPGDSIGIKVSERVRVNDEVLKVVEK